MLISTNLKPSKDEFGALMKKTDAFLNEAARKRSAYFATRRGTLLEDDVKEALEVSARGTPFENTIEKVSGRMFPDIVAAKLFGVEVKSTITTNWKSVGGSILESSRIQGVEKIYMTFGKLGGKPISFLSRPYEECLYGIAVTHMPRYLIDMETTPENSIFNKLGIRYDELRKMDNPTIPVIQYYRKHLRDGERLWWTGISIDEIAPPVIRLWNTIDRPERNTYTIYGCINFPEVFRGSYDKYALWLTTRGIVDPHIRDQFSAGGQEKILLESGLMVRCAGIFRRVRLHADLIVRRLKQKNPQLYEDDDAISDNKELQCRLNNWIEGVINELPDTERDLAKQILCTIFRSYQE